MVVFQSQEGEILYFGGVSEEKKEPEDGPKISEKTERDGHFWIKPLSLQGSISSTVGFESTKSDTSGAVLFGADKRELFEETEAMQIASRINEAPRLDRWDSKNDRKKPRRNQ